MEPFSISPLLKELADHDIVAIYRIPISLTAPVFLPQEGLLIAAV
jgi:hypothetical protein